MTLPLQSIGLFVELKDPITDERYLELKVCHAYDKKKYINKRILAGEWLLGECMLSHSTMFMTDVPDDYIRITWGLGHALPRSIVMTLLLITVCFMVQLKLHRFQFFKIIKLSFWEKFANTQVPK